MGVENLFPKIPGLKSNQKFCSPKISRVAGFLRKDAQIKISLSFQENEKRKG